MLSFASGRSSLNTSDEIYGFALDWMPDFSYSKFDAATSTIGSNERVPWIIAALKDGIRAFERLVVWTQDGLALSHDLGWDKLAAIQEWKIRRRSLVPDVGETPPKCNRCGHVMLLDAAGDMWLCHNVTCGLSPFTSPTADQPETGQ